MNFMKKVVGLILLIVIIFWIYWYFNVIKLEQETKTRDLKRVSKILSVRDELHQNYTDNWFLNSLDYLPLDKKDWEIINWCKIWYIYEVFDIKNEKWEIIRNWWFNYSNCMESKWYIDKAKNDWWIYEKRFELYSGLENKISKNINKNNEEKTEFNSVISQENNENIIILNDNEVSIKDLWNWFSLEQIWDKSNLIYSWKEIYSWNHEYKKTFLYEDFCEKLIDVWPKWKENFDTLSKKEQKECFKENVKKTVSVKKISDILFNIYRSSYEWYIDNLLFNTLTKKIEGEWFGNISKIETWKSGVFIQNFWRWGYWSLIFIDNKNNERKILFQNTDDSFTWKNEDRREIIDFELMINKQIKIFYRDFNFEKKEKIINL